jgi:hypothetical protein
VVKSLGESLENTFCGEISRLELRNLMTRPELFIMKSDFSATVGRPEAEFFDVIRTKVSLLFTVNCILTGFIGPPPPPEQKLFETGL